MERNLLKNINENTKNGLFRMLLILFPSFKLVRIRRDGKIVLRSKKLFSRNRVISFFDAVLLYIPKEVSMHRWHNYDLSANYILKIVSILTAGSDELTPAKVEMVINYLLSEFYNTKVVNIFEDARQIIIPLPEGHMLYTQKVLDERIAPPPQIEEAVIITESSFSLLKEVRRVPVYVKTAAAAFIISLFLNYRLLLTSLVDTGIISNLINLRHTTESLYTYPWVIIPNSG